MTIRYQCPECDSVLKIKDELAGTDGKCPKCKSKFVVPEPNEADEPAKEKTASKAASSKKKSKPAAKKSAKADDDDFDPAAFLMEDGPGPKASAGLTEKPAEPSGPATDKQGRRHISGGGGARAKAASHSPAAVAADAELNASANARDLLSKTADESRVKASTMPMEEKQPMFDFSGMGKELVRYSPHLIGGILGIVLLYGLSWYMMKGKGIELPPLSDVTGKVTVNGEPLAGVQVTFSPLEDTRSGGDGPERIRSSSGRTDENGEFTLYYIDRTEGAARGKGRISVTVQSAQDLLKLPKNWARSATRDVEVKEANREGDFDINIVAEEESGDDKKPKKN